MALRRSDPGQTRPGNGSGISRVARIDFDATVEVVSTCCQSGTAPPLSAWWAAQSVGSASRHLCAGRLLHPQPRPLKPVPATPIRCPQATSRADKLTGQAHQAFPPCREAPETGEPTRLLRTGPNFGRAGFSGPSISRKEEAGSITRPARPLNPTLPTVECLSLFSGTW